MGRQWRDISYADWPAALRSQVNALISQEIDYETILHYLWDLEYCAERLSEYRKRLPEYIRQQIEESLANNLLWTRRGKVPAKRLATVNLEFALAKLKEGDIDVALRELKRAIEHLESRLQEIEDIRKGINRRLESIYLYIRNSDVKEKLTLVKEKLNQGALEEAEDLVSELYQNYFTAVVEEGSYKYLQRKIVAISSAIENLKKLSQQESSISDELARRKRSHNDLQAQITPLNIKRGSLQKQEKRRPLDEIERIRLEDLKSSIRPLEKEIKSNQAAIQGLKTELLNIQNIYLDISKALS